MKEKLDLKSAAFSFLENSSMLVCFASEKGEVLYLNQSGLNMLGLSGEEAVKKTILDLHPKRYREKILSEVLPFAFEKGEWNGDLLLSSPNGSILVQETIRIEKAEDGEIESIVLIAEDVLKAQANSKSYRSGEILYSTLLSAVEEGILFVDSTGTILRTNQSLEKMLGVKTESIVGHSYHSSAWRTIYPDGRVTHMEESPIYYTLSTGLPVRREVLGFVKSDLQVLWAHVTTVPLFDPEADRMMGVVVTISDITKEKENEDRLKQLSMVASQTGDAVLITDLDGKILFVNPAFEIVTGYLSEEAIGQFPSLLKSGVHSPEFYREMWDVISKGETFRATITNRKKEGALFYCEQTINPLRDAKGRILYYVSLLRDVTEKMESFEKLRLSEENYRILFENSIEGIFSSSYDGKFIQVNPAMSKITGYSKEELLSLDLQKDLYVHGDQRSFFLNMILQNSKIEGEIVQLKKKDGSTIYVEVFAVAHFDSNGNMKQIDGRMIDISPKIAAEEERNFYEKKLRQSQKLEALGTLISSVAHEINNPLMCILGYSQILSLEMTDPAHIKFAGIITEEAKRLSSVVVNLLDFSRKESDSFKKYDIARVVESAVSLLDNVFEKNYILVETEFELDLPLVEMREQLIRQVLINLLVNSKDALNTKYPERNLHKRIIIRLEACVSESEPYVKLTLEDSGQGIPSEILKQIYDPFFTTKREQGGTGLGIPISQGIIKEHNGFFTIQSVYKRYTICTILLPVTQR
ncbi:PAS domain-containing sensor histidine kinase [Leptospira tipperaryensis]|uniref:PAS domain-containing sensor histidine kinase n=1 Tax=Leptospira tipperaryensis TaxID=2564040 RepID=UPI00249F3B3B|nr:PAS domain-containing sensor histidine kinase [Leptospira tipperaryensis]